MDDTVTFGPTTPAGRRGVGAGSLRPGRAAEHQGVLVDVTWGYLSPRRGGDRQQPQRVGAVGDDLEEVVLGDEDDVARGTCRPGMESTEWISTGGSGAELSRQCSS
jgi:hypothetical protein